MKSHTQKRLGGIVVLLLAVISTAICSPGSLVRAQKTTRLATTPGTTASQGPVRALPFEPSEELIYVAEFSRALLKKIDVADFRFTASREPPLQKVSELVQDQGGSSYSLKLTGDISSKGFFTKLFNLRFREQIESTVEPATFTVKKTKKLDVQGKRERVSETNYVDGTVFWKEHDPNNPTDTPREASAPFAGQVQDVLSAIYYLRTQRLEVGRGLELTVSDSGRVYQVPVRVVEKKRMKTALGRIEALRVDPEVFGAGRMIPSEGRFSIWFTNDSRRIPVSARIKTRYGTFDVTLRRVLQNLTPRESLATAESAN